MLSKTFQVPFTLFAMIVLVTAAQAEENEHICRYHDAHQLRAAGFLADANSSGPHYAPDRHVDILHIKIDVTPNFKDRTVSGTTTITFAPIAEPLAQLRLDAVNLTILNVKSKAPVAEFVSTAEDLTIVFEHAIAVGKKTVVIIAHEAQPSRGLYFRTPEMGYPDTDSQVWTQGETHEARHWFPCYDYPNERSSSEIICHVPREMTVLANGRKLSESIDAESGLKSVRWLQEKPHVAYLICLVAGNMKGLKKQHRDVPLGFYTQPSLFEHAANSFADTADIMAFFEQEIGIPFPWDKYDQVTIRDFTAGGMENTTLTTLTHGTIFSKATENIRTTRRLDAHEMAHQWFGDYLTCKDWSHLWLNEGFATYYAHLYEGHKFGRDAMLYGLYRDAQGRVLRNGNDKKPIVYRDYTSEGEQFDYRAYPKGSWVLHMLRSQLGEELYRKCVKTYLERHALTSVVTEDLNAVIEELSGRSFDPFFDQWVYHARFPDLRISYRWLPAEKLASVSVEQTHTVDDDVLLFRFPTKLRFMVDGKAVDFPIRISKKRHEFYVPLDAQPSIVRFDPDYTVLANVTFSKPDDMLFAQLSNQADVIGRVRAAEALAKRKTLKSVTHLKTALNSDPFFGVRIAASSALRQIRDDNAFAALTDSMHQTDARVRNDVVQKVTQFYRPETFDLLQKVLATEKNPAILVTAIRGLGRFDGQRSRPLILKFLRSKSFRNELAAAALGAIRMQDDASYRPALVAVVRSREHEFTSSGFGSALQTLAHISRTDDDKTEVLELIKRHINHPKSRIQRAAIQALGTLGDVRATAVLTTLTGEGNGDRLASAAKAALSQLQKKDANLVPAEVSELRKAISKLQANSEKLKRDFDDLKAKLKAQADAK